MMNPVPWLQMTNMISYQGLVRTFPRETIGVRLSQNIDNEIVTQINLAASLILIQYSIKNARIINHIYKDIYQTKQPTSQLRIRIFLYVIDKTQFFINCNI